MNILYIKNLNLDWTKRWSFTFAINQSAKVHTVHCIANWCEYFDYFLVETNVGHVQTISLYITGYCCALCIQNIYSLQFID